MKNIYQLIFKICIVFLTYSTANAVTTPKEINELIFNKKFIKAEEVLISLTAEKPNSALAFLILSEVQFELEKYKESSNNLEKYKTLALDNANYNNRANELSNKLKIIKNELNNHVKLNPNQNARYEDRLFMIDFPKSMEKLFHDNLSISRDLMVNFEYCGKINAFFQRKNESVYMCNELYTAFLNNVINIRNIPSDKKLSTALSGMLYVMFHEIGHGLVYIENIPIIGREETAVDALATYLILRGGELDSIQGALYMNEFFATAANDYQKIHDPTDTHESGTQRKWNFMCYAYSKFKIENKIEIYKKLIEKHGDLPDSRKIMCDDEYEKLKNSVDKLFGKFINVEAKNINNSKKEIINDQDLLRHIENALKCNEPIEANSIIRSLMLKDYLDLSKTKSEDGASIFFVKKIFPIYGLDVIEISYFDPNKIKIPLPGTQNFKFFSIKVRSNIDLVKNKISLIGSKATATKVNNLNDLEISEISCTR